jgi:hypothetical protein
MPYLSEIIIREVENYSLEFANRLQIDSIMLEITRRCTNVCAHCANYGSPQAKEYLTLKTVKNIIDQALMRRHQQILLWGGEPFLHPDFSEILEYCLQAGLDVYCNTNAFWATSEQAVRSFVERFVPLLRDTQSIKLAVSCDKFHQKQELTPLRNIACLLKVLVACQRGFDYEIQSVEDAGDNTFADLLNLMPEHVAQKCLHKHKVFALERSVGRAKGLPPDESLNPYLGEYTINSFSDIDQEAIRIFITATGDVVLYENWVGDKIASWGNIKNDSLEAIDKKLNSSKFFKLLHSQPIKYFFYPFRKYLNIQKLAQDVAESKIKNRYFLRDAVAGLMQVQEKQFDKTRELNQARMVYLNKFDTEQALACLQVISLYGDFTDRFSLKYLENITENIQVKQMIRQLLSTVYSL